jgi:putative DNA primase/helicase
MFRGQLLYCHSNKKWLKWDGKFWNYCNANEQDIYAKDVVPRLTDLAAQTFKENLNDPDIKSILNNPKQILSNKRRSDMIQSASTEEGMYIKTSAELDAKTMLLGCANGVVDLNSGQLLNHNPNMLMTKSTNVIFDRFAQCPLWEAFLYQTFLGDKDTITYLQKSLGYSLTGDVSEELVHFCIGFGRNGKTLLTNVIYNVLGDYSIVIDTDMLMAHDNQSPNAASPQVTRLQGARFAVANEIEDGRRLNDKHLKILASKQSITAREMYSSPIEFMPQHKIWVTTNHKPAVSDHTEALWRRVRVVPFRHTVPLEEVDYKLEDKLLEEKSGILNWLIDGCLMWQKDRLLPSEEIKRASAEYKKESDILGSFIDERCTFEKGASVVKSVLYSDYKVWCSINSHYPLSQIKFTSKLVHLGIEEKRSSSERMYLGLKLNNLS